LQPKDLIKVSVDCVVIGGGPSGLWALDVISQEKNRSCLLLEKHLLGSDQAEHAEWFLHRGAVFRALEKDRAPYVSRLKEGVVGWNRLVGNPAPMNCVGAESTVFWLDDKRVLWSLWCEESDDRDKTHEVRKLAPIGATEAKSDDVQWSGYAGSSVAFSTNEQSARQSPLLTQLRSEHSNKLLSYLNFKVVGKETSNCVHSIIVDDRYEIEAGAIVVASGSENDRILKSEFDCKPPSEMESHHSMLDGLILSVLDPTCSLRLFNSFAAKNELMVVCRKCPQGHHWLISGAGSWGTKEKPVFGDERKATWVPTIWANLLEQFPIIRKFRENMSYRIVKGRLVQPAFRKDKPSVSNVYSPAEIGNVVAVFPQRLSCAPAFGIDVADRVEAILTAVKWEKCVQPDHLPVNEIEIAVSSYEKDPGTRMTWNDFKDAFALPD
jgi:hypothetical protein